MEREQHVQRLEGLKVHPTSTARRIDCPVRLEPLEEGRGNSGKEGKELGFDSRSNGDPGSARSHSAPRPSCHA